VAESPTGGHARPAISEEEVSALLEKRGAADAAQPFDFSSRRINRTQLPMLEYLCKDFAVRTSASLASLLNRSATLQFEGLHGAKAADLRAALPSPSSVASVSLKPLPGQSFVIIEPALLLGLLDGFFGGSGRAAAGAGAAAAPAAQRFLGLLIRALAADLAAAWAPVAAIEPEIGKQETNPRFIQFGEPQTNLVVANFAVELGALNGRISWLFPDGLIAPIREALASETGRPAVREPAIWAPAIGAALQGAEVRTRAVLAEAEISLGDLVRLAPGDIIPIEAPQQATLLAGGVPLYRARFGVSQGRNALKILPRGSA
jgi:flagellar motor switch protein FliM